MTSFLEFEKPIAELEDKINGLLQLNGEAGDINMDIEEDVQRLKDNAQTLLTDTYANLTPWQKTLVARHPSRPHFRDYVAAVVDDFIPLAGDRAYADDKAIIGGLGRISGRTVMIIGHEKGWDTKSRVAHNFGSARPEGYRKAQRLMRLADKFKIPVVTFIDTAGAYPGVGAEERGQAEAIAQSTNTCLELGVPLIACIVGEGGSGGAVALATGNQVLMFEHAIYAVISPEGCASILWRAADKAQDAASAMKITAQDLTQLQVIDSIIPEPIGGAHRDPKAACASLSAAITGALAGFDNMGAGEIRAQRREKFLEMGKHGLV
jgi:acetyl-CoA carboxylase carboxyl transferase subunit alpha